ncbi:MAG TPA: hypothetical protein VMB85_16690 [Bryobacteraceae bacterium]|nr:hypothetical protein [Bryobacteraceae bacterium]
MVTGNAFFIRGLADGAACRVSNDTITFYQSVDDARNDASELGVLFFAGLEKTVAGIGSVRSQPSLRQAFDDHAAYFLRRLAAGAYCVWIDPRLAYEGRVADFDSDSDATAAASRSGGVVIHAVNAGDGVFCLRLFGGKNA